MQQGSNNKKQKTILDCPTCWYRYPPPSNSSSNQSFQIGDLVFLRSKSGKERGQRGHIIAKAPTAIAQTTVEAATISSSTIDAVTSSLTDDTSSEPPLLVVKLHDGREKKAKRCIRVFDPLEHPSIIVTSETMSYRILSSSQLTQDDVVLEIGCSTGEASVIMNKYCGDWMGFDTSDSMIKRCKSQLGESAKAYKVDALSDPVVAEQLVKDGLKRQPTKVFLDIGGNRECEGVLRMISWVLGTFSPTILVVKSRELVGRLAEDLSVEDNTGLFVNGDSWMKQQMLSLNRKVPKHPLQAPLRYIDGSPICRYHNYHAEGCKRFRSGSCEFDHDHCHVCLLGGHIALTCSHIGT